MKSITEYRLTSEEYKLALRCEKEIKAVENGTANKQQITNLMRGTVNPIDTSLYDVYGFVGTEALKSRFAGDYMQLLNILKKACPQLDEKFIPFLAADCMKAVCESEGDKNE